jgi:hypothetical protein
MVIKGKDNLVHKAHDVSIPRYRWISTDRSKRPIVSLSIKVPHEKKFGVKRNHLIFHGFDKVLKRNSFVTEQMTNSRFKIT